MNRSYAQLALFLPRPFAIRAAVLVDALWGAFARGARLNWPAPRTTWRNVDAVDGLDARTLRDIGADGWMAARDVAQERDALRSRIDAEFRG